MVPIWSLFLAFGFGIVTHMFWQAISFLSARGIGPDGPTAERRTALASGWNGIGPLPQRGGVHATSLMTNPPEPPTPVARPATPVSSAPAVLATV
jgi:hypothetical protein